MALIMVVDDDEMNREIMTEYLQLAGYTVEMAHNGKTALQAVQKQAPHLILMDVNMPDLSGYEVCEKLHTDEHTSHIPIVLVTGYNSLEDRERGLAAGAVEFLSRPFDVDELFQLIQQHLLPDP